jgi:hypothetical protein
MGSAPAGAVVPTSEPPITASTLPLVITSFVADRPGSSVA